MSYARFGWEGSDVYVFCDVGGHLNCCGCKLGETSWHSHSTDEMIAHLREHIAAGHTVPEYVIPDLEQDREENDQFIEESR